MHFINIIRLYAGLSSAPCFSVTKSCDAPTPSCYVLCTENPLFDQKQDICVE